MKHLSDQELKLLKKKNKFLIQYDMFEEIKILKDSDVVLLIYSMYEYVIGRVLPDLDLESQIPVKMAFNRFKKQHDENERDWLHGRMQKIEAGRKGGLSRRDKK